ncbi:Mu-like prophage major head subunit gpT family protein [Candidatus Magnetominusculus xianensis]|uniref:Phage head protein n=1 Tax=Candidatus Magnetominusculus xianensis TaxID=1748249 RepID=A0ABR5SDK5_9BACT|nr:Mu-like prophage major head subunit gpT family protein [Candidatus Magnetominusculus xianensis]KWT81146.1 phage head protein [Candidatus Magnetominusculus xianensis]MBF0402976.1 Mu-like prophage major head subunit gpT family protein [Nitrospirota bacterium]
MELNQATLGALYQGFNTIFQQAFDSVPPQYQRVAMTVPSNTSEEKYAWMGVLPKMREWVGERFIHNLKTHDYSIKNLQWEMTIAVNANNIKDNTLGIFNPVISDLGRTAATHPDELVFGLLPKGLTTACYDGKNFFDDDHPVGSASVSNYGGGAGTAWYLLDVSRSIKPLVFQVREETEFVALDRPEDVNVFMRNEYFYGARRRDNAGFGLWQLAYCSKQSLDATNYAAARAAMLQFKDDSGRPLGVNPGLLVVSPSQEGEARALMLNEMNAAGATNTWRNTAELLVVSWL